ncbi:MAG: sigma-70 family RNA polymerase sigma factor [Pseudomonadota bacterium]
MVAADFQRVYEAEASSVWNCLRRLGVADRDLEDKVHDVFVVAYRKLAQYDQTRPIRPWLSGIAVKIAADHRRRAHVQREVMQEEVQVADESVDPERVAQGNEARALVHAALAKLDEERRTLLLPSINQRFLEEEQITSNTKAKQNIWQKNAA